MSGDDKDTKAQKPSGGSTVTEEDLLKSLADLESKEPEKKPAADPKVETATLEKSARDKIDEEASEELKKALDVSSALSEITSLLGAHVDDSLEALQKSVHASAERDMKIIAVLEKFQKSLDGFAEKLANFGGQPAKAPTAQAATGDAGNVETLRKSIPDADKAAAAGKLSRQAVLGVMEELAKSASNEGDKGRWVHAAIKFESTGQISNDDLLTVKSKLTKAA
jgi:ABC-type transporter Mla subunit MlaD